MVHNRSIAEAIDLGDAENQQLAHQIEALEAENGRLRQQNDLLRRRITELQREVEIQHQINDRVELLKAALVRNVSHELKTPLLHVKSAIALISETFLKMLTTATSLSTLKMQRHALSPSFATLPSSVLALTFTRVQLSCVTVSTAHRAT